MTTDKPTTTAIAQPEKRALALTDAYIRHYTDNDQHTAYVEWNDGARTEGPPESAHMLYLFLRANKEGVRIRRETW